MGTIINILFFFPLLTAKLKQQQNQTETSKTTSSSSTTSANATLATSNKDSSSEEGYVSAELAQAEQSASELLAKLPPESPLLQAVEAMAKQQQQQQLMQQQVCDNGCIHSAVCFCKCKQF